MLRQLRPSAAVRADYGAEEMASRVREFDWARHPLGPQNRWPASLRIAVDICLRSRFPMNVLWGPDLVQIYNDGYRPMLGAKHPIALGQPVRECWREAANVIGPLLDDVVASGRSCWFEDLPIIVNRHGFDEQTYYTFSYSPIEEGGAVRGVFVTVSETTPVVVGRRRLSFLHDLALCLADVSTIDDVCAALTAVIRDDEEALPAAALYLVDETARSARLCACEGLAGDLPATVRAGAPAGSPVARAMASLFGEEHLPVRIDLPGSPDGTSPAAVLLSLPLPERASVAGALVLGTNPRLPLDGAYREFLDIVGSHVAAALARVHAHDEERRRVAARAAMAEQTRAEAALRRQALVFDTVSEAVLITDPAGRVLDCNPAAEHLLGVLRAELVGRPLDRRGPTANGEDTDEERLAIADREGLWAGETEFGHGVYGTRVADETVVPQRNAEGQAVAFIRVARDVTERRRSEEWAAGQRHVLELTANGRPVTETLDALARLVERQLPSALCSILRCESGRLFHGAAPSLPKSLVPGPEGAEVDPCAGPCAAAAFHRKPVIATSAEAATGWPQYLALAQAHELRFTWSTPIIAPDHSVLGTFALFWRTEHEPTQAERELVNDAARLAGIAIARHQSEQLLRRQAVVFETLSEAVILADAEGRVMAWNPAMEALTGFAQVDVLGTTPPITHPPERHARIVAEVIAAAEQDGRWTAELPFMRKDGCVRLGEIKVVADRDRDGRMVGMVGIARDITDRRRAEDALRRRNEQLAAIVQMQHEVATTPLDTGAVMRRIAECAARLTGADGALVGVPDGQEIVMAAARGCYAPRLGARVAREKSLSGECLRTGRALRIDDLWAETEILNGLTNVGVRSVIVVPLLSEQQRIGVLGVGATSPETFDDDDVQALTLAAGVLAAALAHAMAYEAKRQLVQERTSALAALEQSEERLRALSECSPDGVFTADVAGRCTYVNRRLTELVGLEADRFLGDGWQQIVHAGDRAAFVAAWNEATAVGAPVSREMRFMSPGRGPVVMHVRSAPLVLGSGQLVGFVGTCQDVTERREAEDALRRAERLYRELVESVDAIVWRAAGSPARLTFVSQQAEAVLGVSAQDLVGQTVLQGQWIHAEDREAARVHLREAQRSPDTVQHEFRAWTTDGRELWLRSLMRRTPDSVHQGEIIGVTFDVTELHHAREGLARSRQQLRDLASALQTIREGERTRISREIHDELGQSLTGLKMEAAWLRSKLPKRSPPLAASADQMIVQIDGMIEDVRRIASELRPHVLDSLGLVAALEWQVREFERRAKLRCRLRVEGMPPQPSVDRSTAVFRIVQEALTNVARHARATTVAVAVSDEGDRFQVTVRDDGCGIPIEAIHGTGSLGILGMRERAITCGGELTIALGQTRGTVVTVQVPLDRESTTPERVTG